MKAAVYYADTDCLLDAARFEAARSAVSRERREKTDRMRFPQSKRLSLGAGLLLMRALSDAGLDPNRSGTAEGERGKPYLTAYPEVCFNLSHSGRFAMCVIADAQTGCDIERIGEARPEIAKRFFDGEEIRDIFGTEEPFRTRLFYRYWTLKESYIKCLGLGMGAALNSFRIRESETGITVLDGEGILPYSLIVPACPDGYAAACCFACTADPITVETETVDLVNFIDKCLS